MLVSLDGCDERHLVLGSAPALAVMLPTQEGIVEHDSPAKLTFGLALTHHFLGLVLEPPGSAIADPDQPHQQSKTMYCNYSGPRVAATAP
ncbi:hypothetical protein AAKU55_003366 [Oxalobacteraceae bacterium GrIS 1.11]